MHYIRYYFSLFCFASQRHTCVRLCLCGLVLAVVFGCAARPKEGPSEEPSSEAVSQGEKTQRAGQSLRYVVSFEGKDEAKRLIGEVKENSHLVWLQGDAPDSRVALERRVLEDVATAVKILHSHGYYDGKARHRIDWDARPVSVQVVLTPGDRYTIGVTRLHYERSNLRWEVEEPVQKILGKDFMQTAPQSLEAFGLLTGQPAEAKSVLDAVSAVFAAMRREGYPLAEAGKTTYIIDRSTHTLQADVLVKTGPLLRMGSVQVREDGTLRDETPPVSEDYLNDLTPWIEGQFWDEALVKAYHTTLQETGLFSSIEMQPARLPASPAQSGLSVQQAGSGKQGQPTGNSGEGTTKRAAATASEAPLWMTTKGTTPLDLIVRTAPPRTVSGGMVFSTDTGFGVRGAWENRNLFGGGEQLRVTAPLSQTSQSLTASFRKPAFGIRDQALVGEAWAINEETDAYDQSAMSVAGGLERRFRKDWRNWWASARVSLEAGRLDDNLHGGRSYALFGVPLAVRRDTTNDLLNPTEGTRLSLEVTPYTGTFTGPLTTIRTRIDVSGYYAPFESKRLVLAARAVAGSLTGERVEDLPASLRFYTGGGGSVRGYKYQSLGPKDRRGDPLGGLSFTDVNLEARIRITDTFGLVPFIDGGMVYESSMPDWGRDLAWGAGLGFRYFTPIGPVRLDIATPLQNRDNNKAFQLYLSIGQAF